MRKRVLDVGQCRPDHAAIRNMLSKFPVDVIQADTPAKAMEYLHGTSVHLVLVNRKIDVDYTEGIELIKMMQADPSTKNIPVMMISNYPEAQEAAVAAGAKPGFGKNDLKSDELLEHLKPYIGEN